MSPRFSNPCVPAVPRAQSHRLCHMLCLALVAIAEPGATAADLATAAAFGLPLESGQPLCDSDQLRVHAWNDDRQLVVQAVVWHDADKTLGETADGRKTGDRSTLVLDVDNNGQRTPRVDRSYLLNPWPSTPGLRYSIPYEGGASSHIKPDSTGRGCIRYLPAEGRTVRVDTWVIPLAEIGRVPGDTIRLAVLVASPAPAFVANSVGYESPRAVYYARSLPWANFHSYRLADAAPSLNTALVPAGREDEPAVKRGQPAPMPDVGAIPPEFAATAWLNTEERLTLADLKGRLVLVDFWATWCGPCVAGIPHLNALQKKYADDLTIVSFTDQSRRGIENFLKQQSIDYAIGTGSQLSLQYGVVGLPHAFLIGRDGRLLWHAVPTAETLDEQIEAALSADQDR